MTHVRKPGAAKIVNPDCGPNVEGINLYSKQTDFWCSESILYTT